MARSKWKNKVFRDNLVRKKYKRIFFSNFLILKDYLGINFFIYRGNQFHNVLVTEDKIGYKLSSFLYTRHKGMYIHKKDKNKKKK